MRTHEAMVSFTVLCYFALQRELDEIASLWNCHRIRRGNNPTIPYGRPIVMYNAPRLYDTRDYSCPIDDNVINICVEECTFISDQLCSDKNIFDLASILMEENM